MRSIASLLTQCLEREESVRVDVLAAYNSLLNQFRSLYGAQVADASSSAGFVGVFVLLHYLHYPSAFTILVGAAAVLVAALTKQLKDKQQKNRSVC